MPRGGGCRPLSPCPWSLSPSCGSRLSSRKARRFLTGPSVFPALLSYFLIAGSIPGPQGDMFENPCRPTGDEHGPASDLFPAAFVHPGIDPADATNFRPQSLNVRKILGMRGQVHLLGSLIGGNTLRAQLGHLREEIGKIGLERAYEALIREGRAMARQIVREVQSFDLIQ